MPYVYSTLTNSTTYVHYKPTDPKQLSIRDKSVTIRGGANLPTKTLVTPLGVATKVSDEDMEWLEKDYHFKEHVKQGFLIVDKRNVAPEKMAESMKKRDLSSPKIPTDAEFKNNPPKVAAPN